MGNPSKNARAKTRDLTATDLFSGTGSEPRRLGRRLKMWFISRTKPELLRAEYHCGNKSEFSYLQQQAPNKDHRFTFTDVPAALSLLFIEYCCAGLEGREQGFVFSGERQGSLAASLGYALKKEGKIHTLFTDFPPEGGDRPGTNMVIGGTNLEGKEDRERTIFIKSDYLAADCIEVYWEGRLLKAPSELRELNLAIRNGWALESSRQPPPVAAETGSPMKYVPPSGQNSKNTGDPSQFNSSNEARAGLARMLADVFRGALEFLREKPKAESHDFTEDKVRGKPEPATSQEGPTQWFKQPDAISLPAIDPQLFQIRETGRKWPDHTRLIAFPDDDIEHAWTLKHAFEGILILGRTGSGKSSGSGSNFAQTLLRNGFGGLVLTVKTDEAEHWRKLCKLCGREDDLVIVERGGKWKFNLLAYEAQHPGRGKGLSENFTSFCRNLLQMSVRTQGGGGINEAIWERAGDQVLNATFDLFLLGGGNITFDRLAEFIAAAPTGALPTNEDEWLKIPVFGNVLLKARDSAETEEDKRIFRRATHYWFKVHRTYDERIRSSVALGIYSMLDCFRGRDIPDLISSETNITPEMIMSEGKIVVLDLPQKELGKMGVIIQSAWKYLFQVALERRQRVRNPQQRPVFLWEDEAQYFLSEHDHHFQDTARSARVCRVMLTQNVNSFYKELSGRAREAANVVFGNLNTKVFHNNSDHETNVWASNLFGQEITMRSSFSSGPRPQPRDIIDSIGQSLNPPNRTTVSSAEHWENVVRPEDFHRLSTGGPETQFLVEAYITWMGLNAENGRHFIKIAFEQNRDL